MRDALNVFLFTLPAAGLICAAALLSTWRPFSTRAISLAQHFAAGLVFATTALELLPQERGAAAVPVIVGFELGLGLMLGIRHFAGVAERRKQAQKHPVGMLVVTAVDLVIVGLVLGIAFAAGDTTGALLAFALSLEVLFLTLSVHRTMATAGLPRRIMFSAPPAFALLLSLSAVVGRVACASLSPFPFAILLGAGTVALLYLITEELLVKAREVAETQMSITSFFLGFLLFLLIEKAVEA